MTEDERRHEDGPAKDGEAKPSEREHPAGPHADPRLTNEDATPGAGTLPDLDKNEVDPGAG